jgi:hypothetical protein
MKRLSRGPPAKTEFLGLSWLFSVDSGFSFHGDPACVYATCFLAGFESRGSADEAAIRGHLEIALLGSASCLMLAWEGFIVK